MEAHTVKMTCAGCCSLSTHRNSSKSCDNYSRNSSTNSIYQQNDSNNDDDLKCLIQLYRSIPDYRDVNHLSELEFYNKLELLKKTSKELKASPKVHIAACHSHIDLPIFCPVKKLRSRKKRNRKSILACGLNNLPSMNCHEISKTQKTDMKLLKVNSVSPASTTSKTPEQFSASRKDDLTNRDTNTTPESKKCLEKDLITEKSSSKSNQNICGWNIKANEHKTTKNKNRLKEPSISWINLATRPNLAATLRLECSKKKIKDLTKDFHYPDRCGISASLFDWEIRKSPSWKALSSKESHKKLLAVKLATRKAEQTLLKHEYELNMEIMRQKVKSAPLLFERTNYWTTNVGKIKHNCQKAYNGPQVCVSCHHKDHHCQNGNSCYSLKPSNKRRCSHFLKPAETDLEYQLNSIQLSEHKHKNLIGKNMQNNSDKVCPFPLFTKCHHHQNQDSSKKRSQSNRKRLFQVTSPSMATAIANDSGDDLCSLDKAYL